MQNLQSGWLEDKGTWLVVYYDNEIDEEKESLQALKEALASAETGVVPDIWINSQDMIVKLPHCREDYQLNNAAFKRLKVEEDWEEYPILKIRHDSGESFFIIYLIWDCIGLMLTRKADLSVWTRCPFSFFLEIIIDLSID